MLLEKPEKWASSEWLWQYDDDSGEKNLLQPIDGTVLLFGVLYLNKFSDDHDTDIRNLLAKLNEYLNQWNNLYPWSDFNGIRTRLERMQDNSYAIVGQLTVDDHVREEEAIVIAILQKFSLNLGPDVFIRVCDSDGDFLLMECHDALPKAYEYPIANNRFWLHEGKFKLIPDTYKSGEGLDPEEALEFLRNEYFKLIEIKSLTTEISKKMVTDFPRRYLSNLKRLPIMVEDKSTAELLQDNPQISSFLIRILTRRNIKISMDHREEQQYPVELLTPQRHCDMLSIFLIQADMQNCENLPLYIGRSFYEAIKGLLSSGEMISRNQNKTMRKEQPKEVFFDVSDCPLYSPSINEDSWDNEQSEKDVIEQIGHFLKEDIQKSDLEEQHINTDNENADDRIDYDSMEYFSRENIDIDEDDFFEFFLKEALKIDQDSINSYRNVSSKNTTAKSSDISASSTSSINERSNSRIREVGEIIDGKERRDPMNALNRLLGLMEMDEV